MRASLKLRSMRNCLFAGGGLLFAPRVTVTVAAFFRASLGADDKISSLTSIMIVPLNDDSANLFP